MIEVAVNDPIGVEIRGDQEGLRLLASYLVEVADAQARNDGAQVRTDHELVTARWGTQPFTIVCEAVA